MEGVAEYAFRHHRTEIYRYLRRRTKSSDQAEELTQQVFADAAITLSRMDAGPGSVLGLLYTIARRRFADEARRNGQHGEQVPLQDVGDELPAPEYGSELAHAIREAIAQSAKRPRRCASNAGWRRCDANSNAKGSSLKSPESKLTLDPEVIELLKNDAALLAIADAVAATQARRGDAADEADRGQQAAPGERSL